MTNGVVRHMPLINGVEYGWASITANIGGTQEVAITAISYSDKQTINNIYGAGQHPIGRGYGKIEATASITLLMSAVENIRSASSTGRLQDIAPFDIVVTFVASDDTKIVKHVIKNCQFTEDNFDAKVDDTSFEIALPLLPSHIIWNA